jgi:hypothetical protein
MGKLKLIGSNLVTALLVCAVTSAFWINAYADDDATPPRAEPAPERAEKQATIAEAADEVAVAPSGLAVPVAGIRPDQLIDTYKQARSGGARVHDAIDIMAITALPSSPPRPGRLEKLFFRKAAAAFRLCPLERRAIYLYYAHLQDYAPGLKEGRRSNAATRSAASA